MKKTVLFILGFLFVVSLLNAVLLLNENFDFTGNLTDNGWTAHSGSGTNPINTTTGLTYTGYASSGIGNAALVDNTGEDDHRTFTSQTSGVVYASFLVNVTNATTSGDYFFHVMRSSATFNRGRVFAKDDGSGNLEFGLSKSQTASSATFTDNDYNYDTTYLLVLKYEIVTGADNDITSLYIFESPSIPSSEPGSPTLGPDASGTDPSDIGAVALRQGGSYHLSNRDSRWN